MSITIDLEGRRALVTGAGQSVGRAVASTLASAGASVVVNDFVQDRAEAVAAEIGAEGGDATPVQFDVTDYTAVTEGTNALGPFDILVNNAGNAGTAGMSGFELKLFHEEEPDAWERYLGVNLYGVMYCCRAVLPGMIERGPGGRIVTVVSDAARWGEPRLAVYSAAKGGAAAFTRALAREVGRHNITVNNVALSTIDPSGAWDPDTAETDEAAEAMKQRLQHYIIRRFGRPTDVAGVVAFLASEHASWVTGQTYAVNGGYTVS